jgi:K+-sensing histidine kinase KdpD
LRIGKRHDYNPHSLGGRAVPFSSGFQIYPWVERALRVRQYPLAAYGLALVLVALAVFGRKLVGEYAGVQIFTTFYPAIIVATLIGGLWPGILATVLSTVAAWYFLVPQFLSLAFGGHEVVEFLFFVFISAVDVALAVLLNAIVERLVLQQRNIRLLLEAAPNGFVLVRPRNDQARKCERGEAVRVQPRRVDWQGLGAAGA